MMKIKEGAGRPKLNDHKLLDYLIGVGWAKHDAALAKLLKVSPGTISKIRSGKRLSAEFILAVYDNTDLSIEEIREHLAA
jgi:hypothetical protein